MGNGATTVLNLGTEPVVDKAGGAEQLDDSGDSTGTEPRAQSPEPSLKNKLQTQRGWNPSLKLLQKSNK